MSENTKIEWCDHTFNPWEGCQKVGPGCDNCYAEARNARFGGGVAANWGLGAPRRRTSVSNWRKPLSWNANHADFFAEHGHRQRVFCASLADVFDNQVDQAWRRDLFALIAATPNIDWLLLTKRIGNAALMAQQALLANGIVLDHHYPMPSNVWIGATIVNQEEADRDISKLLKVSAAKRFLSMEPLLGPVNLRFPIVNTAPPPNISSMTNAQIDECASAMARAAYHAQCLTVDWVIVGGESGPGARPMHPDWARSLRNQCEAAGVPFLFKQWGEWAPHCAVAGGNEGRDIRRGHVRYLQGDSREPDGHFRKGGAAVARVGKKAAGRLLDGREWNGVPA